MIFVKYYPGDQLMNFEMGGECDMHGDMRGSYRVLVGKLEGKRPFGRPRHRWEGNIKTDLI